VDEDDDENAGDEDILELPGRFLLEDDQLFVILSFVRAELHEGAP
jgi:hypothetical protein